jgi:hypothetical protein
MKCRRILGTGSRLWLLMLRGSVFLTIGSVLTAVSAAQSGWYWQNPLPQGNPLRAVAVVDGKTVISVGDLGTILRTTDGGASWTRQSSGTTAHLYGSLLHGCQHRDRGGCWWHDPAYHHC